MQKDSFAAKQKNILELATFYVGESLCGINILNIQEINKNVDITHVPQAPEYVVGVLNLRGRIVTVIDLGEKLDLSPININKENRNIIVDSQEEQIGLLVDSISDVLLARSDKIEPAPANLGGIKGKFFKGVFKTEDKLIGVLDIEEVLKEE
jgi:purine-binding chemotaxis protein CheW